MAGPAISAAGAWWGRLPTNPGLAPELLALAAVRTLGPKADAWARELRATYPAASDDGLARLAVRRFTRNAAMSGAAAAVTGVFAPVTEVAALAWTHAGLVLHVAAAYGHDPTDAERAVDLLVLTRVHPSAEVARAALAGGQAPARRLAAPMAAQAVGWVALRLASRLVPGAALLIASTGDAAGATRLANRAIQHYRRR